MKRNIWMTAALAALLVLPAAAFATDSGSNNHAVYAADLQPLNASVTGDKTTGHARFVVDGDTLAITINVRHAAPNIEHWQHFHGFKNGDAAQCPSASADKNDDGLVDLIETHPYTGVTMVPFDDDPAAMDVAHGTYPTASSDGNYTYHQEVSIKKLKSNFDKPLDLANRVVYIHGVPDDSDLPDSVQSLGPIPAHVTLPIACGNIHKVE